MKSIVRVVPILPLSLVLVFALWPALAAAQEIQRVPEMTPQQLMASQLSMLASVTLRGDEPMPRETQLTAARILLDEALKLDSNSAGLWRKKIELAGLVNDPSGQLEAMRNYLRLEPLDESMQLRMVVSMLNQEELLDARLERLERLLNSRGSRQLSKPLRSRLATTAAAMALELGENGKFFKWLQEAAELDPVNPTAARMTYELALQRNASSRQLGAAAIQLLRAAPLDPYVRIDLASILLGEGLYEPAMEQFEIGLNSIPTLSPPEHMEMYVRAIMGSGERERALASIQDYQRAMTYIQYQQEVAKSRENLPEGQEPPPLPEMKLELLELPTQLQLLRLAILTGAQRSGAATSDRAAGAFNAVKRDLLALAAEGDEKAGADYLWVGAVFGHDLDAIRAKALEMPENDPLARRVLGWLAIQDGDDQEARQWLTPIATSDPVAAYGLAVLEYDRQSMQARAYQTIAATYGYSMTGAMAAARLHEMGEPVRPSQTGGSLERLIATIPNAMWEMRFQNNPWLDIRMDVPPGRFSFLQPMVAQVTIKNLTTFPMAVGPDHTVPNSALLQFTPSVRGQDAGRPGPLVVELGSRLSLQVGESLTAEVRLDQSTVGQVLSLSPFGTVSMNGTAIVDARQTPQGGMTTGPLGGTYTVRAVQAVGETFNAQNYQAWATALRGADKAEQMLAIARLVTLIGLIPSQSEMQDPQPVYREVVVQAVNETVPDLEPMLQAWAVRYLQPSDIYKQEMSRLIEIAQRSDNILVRVMYLATQVRDPADASLTDAMRSDIPEIRDFATAQRAEIELMLQKQAEMEAMLAEQEAAMKEQEAQQ